MGAYLGSNSIDGGGFNTIIIRTIEKDEAFLQGGLTSYYNPSISRLGQYAFAGQSISNINCPNVTSIGSFAFCDCSNIKNLSFPNCTFIGSGAFSSCSHLTTLYVPNYSSSYVPALFTYCYSLSNVTLNFSAITSLAGTFSYCQNLNQELNFINLQNIGNYTFYQCYNLQQINCPQLQYVGYQAFGYCKKLSQLSLSQVKSISGYAFQNCYNLVSLNLTGISSVPFLSSSYVFVSTPIGGYSASAGQYGSIYVPASLYDSFIVASYWSSVSARIVSV